MQMYSKDHICWSHSQIFGKEIAFFKECEGTFKSETVPSI